MANVRIREIEGRLFLEKNGERRGPLGPSVRDLLSLARLFDMEPSEALIAYLEHRCKEV